VRIGELAQASGTTTKTLRFYEISGLLPPPERTTGGYRDYDADTLGRLDFIRRGRAAGLTLAEIGEVLAVRDAGQPPCQHVEQLLKARLSGLDRQIADLLALRDSVAQLHQAAAGADPDTCGAEQVCRYL